MPDGVASSKTPGRSNYTRRLIDLTLRKIKLMKGKALKKHSLHEKDLTIFTKRFIAHKHKDPNHLWDMFKVEVNRLSTLHIPTRQIKSRA